MVSFCIRVSTCDGCGGRSSSVSCSVDNDDDEDVVDNEDDVDDSSSDVDVGVERPASESD